MSEEKRGAFGEPWNVDECTRALVDRDGFHIEGNTASMARAVACVHALEGLDPEKVRELVEAVGAWAKCGNHSAYVSLLAAYDALAEEVKG